MLLAEALFEKDDDNYAEVVKLLDKALPERSNLSSPGSEPILETMYYYRVRALYKAYDNLKKSDPSRQKSKDVMLKACNEYKDLYRYERFKALQQQDKLYRNHLEDVLQIQNK